MAESQQSDSRKLLVKLRETLASASEGQERLDRITSLIAESLGVEVCSIYLFRDSETLELCATEGLRAEAVHQTRLRVGEGLVGRVARRGRPINTKNAPSERGFRYMPETGEEIYSSFLGVPIQRLGENLGVLVIQSRDEREYSADELYGLEVVAMVLAEMTELGAFVGEGEAMGALHQRPTTFTGGVGQEGAAEGHVWLHDPRVVVTNPVADDPEAEKIRLHEGIEQLRVSVDELLANTLTKDKDQMQVLEAYRMFANSKGWLRRMEEDIDRGLSAEAAVEKEQSAARARMSQVPDAYLRERLHDLDDLSNRLLRILTGQGKETGAELPENPILIATNIGPGELLEYGRGLRGIVLEEGSIASHAAIVARALAIPLIVQAGRISTEALNGDHILVDGEHGIVHLRPEETIVNAFRDKMAMEAAQQERYRSLRDKPAMGLCGTEVKLHMNAGLMADLPSLENSGAAGVGLFRTELQFLTVDRVPRRGDLAATYARVLDAAKGKRVVFRTLDIGSDKVLPYMNPLDEPNPALGWRAIRVGLDKPGVMRMQLQALIRAAAGRDLSVMFPFIAQTDEFRDAREMVLAELERERALGHILPEKTEIGAMLETPSMVFAPQHFYEMADFISIGGNDLKQFFFAADRENERVRRRYDTLNVSFLNLIEEIVTRCDAARTPLSFCGEDAGRPIEAVCFAALGVRHLSMRPASIGPVKHLIRRTNILELRDVIDEARLSGAQSVRPAVLEMLTRRKPAQSSVAV
ncbi:phosphoenolpyruvate--protein phosphotransferase [Aliiroseovarius zhejiangensis]|uniref:phosphoenolpyruvate--protein phosphotransferase n=1 Tax=Aliiroseovarius zhejiangensis TaxID=1632025 RepID=A0ABQ3IW94_9RHOB|nr:phosphoenolpyruvate--protein phosphotransferase [Aliiroseovarius zhejiangensis]GHE91862.1 phosphoenolpyruvate--protein phosphotransferase [Aliiroseovarius zhejiangensis]